MNQADYKKVKECMLDRIWNVFGEPRGAHDFEAFIAEYVNALARYDAIDLRDGTDEIFRTLRVKSWPTIKECIDAVRKCANDRWRAQQKQRSQPEESIPVDKAVAARQAEIDAKMRPLAKLAADQGWIIGLHDFVRDRHRLPTVTEQRKLMDDANFVATCAEDDVDLGHFHAPLKRLAKAMIAKREQLTIRYGAMQ